MNCKCKSEVQIKIKKLRENAKIPTRGSSSAAGYDLYAENDECININPHETKMINTGLSLELPEGTFGAIYPRSGISSKRGLRLANCVGVIDSDYRGEIKVPIHNDTNEIQIIEVGERVAQLVLQSYIPMTFIEVDELNETSRGNNGFGSTGNI